MKAFTDLEQSRKLAEILPHKSADGTWEKVSICGAKVDIPEDMQYQHREIPFSFFSGIGVPCWSLAALLAIFTEQDFTIKAIGNKFNIDIPIRHCKIWFSSLLDAAFEMVIWLKENNKI